MRRLMVVLVGMAIAFSATAAETAVNTAVRGAGKTTRVCVQNATPTKLPTNALGSRKAMEIQNQNSTNAIFCTLGGETPVLPGGAGAVGREIAPKGTWSLNVGFVSGSLVVTCLSVSANQTGDGCTCVSEGR